MHKPTLILLMRAMAPAAGATTPAGQLAEFAAAARSESPGFKGFSAARGERLFSQKGSDWSCASCHTADPRAAGRHAVTGKAIEPFAPVANPKRFTDAAKTAKWFKRNCKDVFSRECTAIEKGDLLTWLTSLNR